MTKPIQVRDHLFKAKPKGYDTWVEGGLYRHDPPLQCIVPKDFVPEQPAYHIIQTGFADWNMPRPVVTYEVDPSTICQFTGEMDKNKKRIFENDILRISEEGDAIPPSTAPVWDMEARVFWSHAHMRWSVLTDDGNEVGLEEFIGCHDVEITVIGNTIDTPDYAELFDITNC